MPSQEHRNGRSTHYSEVTLMNISTSSLLLSIANLRSQTLTSLMDRGTGDSSSFDSILSQIQSGNDATSTTATAPTATNGRNTTLRDPESAYAMMTEINRRDVAYKAQYTELGEMRSYLPQEQEAARQLNALEGTDDNATIKTKLQDFAAKYNAWVDRFGPDVQKGGVLEGTQAAEVPLYELEQVVQNPFLGAMDGFRGLKDLGISIDPQTDRMTLDTAKLDTALASNKQGVVNTLDNFSDNFASSAKLFASDGNFIGNRLANLGGAISYINSNVEAWRQEFGSGDGAKPKELVADALSAYNKTFGL